ncbi:Asp-tRNA(Asn)/Glu-tRNA(Gln) amidotransferase subunit GatA [Candidatus Dependentiae bacterium]|nr:Asp-tRNA(Asn)/Glu-tRNA(Gln) amidotransferase subunit GatA [Candidatus Dependentiae bacterium]
MKPFITVKALREGLVKKTFSPLEIRDFFVKRIAQYNDKLNAVLETYEREPAQTTGILGGIPFLRKDNISQIGEVTSAGSNILKNYKAPFNATVINNLENVGAYSIGRTNMDEFAMGSTGEFSAFGAAKNPWELCKSPGGSSSGSAAAVAAGLVPFALGSETGGSVRMPGSYCNLVGMYPTYGRNSRYGIIAFASSNDQVGPMTQTVYDNALVQSALGGVDAHDATTIQHGPIDYTRNLDGKLPAGIRIGVLKDATESEGMHPDVRTNFDKALKDLEKLGAKLEYVDLPSWKYGVAIYFIIARAEAASNLSRYDGTLYGARVSDAQSLRDMFESTRQQGFGIEIKRRILVGNYVLSVGHKEAFYNQACRVRAMIKAEFDALFKNIDVLISPTSPQLPFSIGETVNDPIAVYLADYFLIPNCMIGTPALQVPGGFSQTGLPTGIQFLGPQHSEELLYKVGHAFEQHTGYYQKNPQGYE